MADDDAALEPDVEPEQLDWREVTIVADHDGEDRKHTFRLRPSMDWKDTVVITGFSTRKNQDELRMLTTVNRLLKRSMVDDDGVPRRWNPEITDGGFVDPGGTLRPVAELDTYAAFDAGSSARRWRALLDDDDVYLDTNELFAAFNGLMGDGADRPTRR